MIFYNYPDNKPPFDGWFIVEFEDNELKLRQYINNQFILEEYDDKNIISWRFQG